MGHDWIFDVLSDLLTFATQNDLPRLAARVAEAIEEARQEIAALENPEAPGLPPSSGRKMH